MDIVDDIIDGEVPLPTNPRQKWYKRVIISSGVSDPRKIELLGSMLRSMVAHGKRDRSIRKKAIDIMKNYGEHIERIPDNHPFVIDEKTGKARHPTFNDKGKNLKTTPPVQHTHSKMKKGVAPHDYFGEMRAIQRWVQDNIRYIFDPRDIEYFQTPRRTMKDRAGDCLAGDEKILMVINGLYQMVPIRDIGKIWNAPNVFALSYNFDKKIFENKKITCWAEKGIKDVFDVRFRNGHTVRMTETHSFPMITDRKTITEKINLTNIDKVKLKDIVYDKKISSHPQHIFFAHKIPSLDKIEIINPMLDGLYVSEGWCEHNRVGIAGKKGYSDEQREEIINWCNSVGVPPGIGNRMIRFNVGKDNINHFKGMGTNAHRKQFHNEYMSSSVDDIKELLRWYGEGDDTQRRENGSGCIFSSHNTVSDKLRDQLCILNAILGIPRTYTPSHMTDRKFTMNGKNYSYPGVHIIHRLNEFANEKWVNKHHVFENLGLLGIKSIIPAGKEMTYDITVEDNHNFVLAPSMVITHNCDDLSVLTSSLLESIGYTTSICLCNPRGKGTAVSHAMCAVKFPREQKIKLGGNEIKFRTDKWYLVETIQPRQFGWIPPKADKFIYVKIK